MFVMKFVFCHEGLAFRNAISSTQTMKFKSENAESKENFVL